MASKSLLLIGLLFAIILATSSDVVSARGLTETKGDVQVDEHHHHCHHPHCLEEGGHHETADHDHEEPEPEPEPEPGHGHSDHHETDDREEPETETTTNPEEDDHHKQKCMHWPHC